MVLLSSKRHSHVAVKHFVSGGLPLLLGSEGYPSEPLNLYAPLSTIPSNHREVTA